MKSKLIAIVGAKSSGKTMLIRRLLAPSAKTANLRLENTNDWIYGTIQSKRDMAPLPCVFMEITPSSNTRCDKDIRIEGSLRAEINTVIYCVDLTKALDDMVINKILEVKAIADKMKQKFILVGTKADDETNKNVEFYQLAQNNEITTAYAVSSRKKTLAPNYKPIELGSSLLLDELIKSTQIDFSEWKLDQEKLKQERLDQERLDQERLDQERLEQERLEQEKLEQEKLEQEKLEQEKLEQEKLEQEKPDQEKPEQERLEQERLDVKTKTGYTNSIQTSFEEFMLLLKTLPTEKQNALIQAWQRYAQDLTQLFRKSNVGKVTARTQTFESECKQILNGSSIQLASKVIAIMVVTAVVAATISSFGLGLMICGAFFAAKLAITAAAATSIAVSSTAAYTLFKPSPIIKPLETLCNNYQQLYSPQKP